jgi:hypothetical protein
VASTLFAQYSFSNINASQQIGGFDSIWHHRVGINKTPDPTTDVRTGAKKHTKSSVVALIPNNKRATHYGYSQWGKDSCFYHYS